MDSGDDSEAVTPVEDGGNLRMRPFGPLLISFPRDTLDSSDTMGGEELAGGLISGTKKLDSNFKLSLLSRAN